MKLNRDLRWNSVLGGLAVGIGIIALGPTARGNVYATNIRINDGITNIVASPGDTITISYLLNEPASLGTTVQLRSGTTLIRSLFFPNETQGTLRGFNAITWDGLSSNGQNAPGGTYSVTVTAAASGYTNWTQITSDVNDQNTVVYDGRGIAVDRNQGSPYYGRIFVANSSLLGSTPLGILKFNADTSDAEEGVSSADMDGHNWSGGDVSPWKIAVSADDYVYVDDLANGGEVYRWDPTISSNSILYVLRQDNQSPGAELSGPAVVGTGTNTQIWMVDTNLGNVLKWSVTASSVCAANDTGITNIMILAGSSNLLDVAVDKDGNVYACAFVTANGDPSQRVFRYHAFDPSTNGGMAETNADWAVGTNDDTYTGASGIAIDPTGTYVAVAFQGLPSQGFSTNGNTKILWATNGAVAANLDLGVVMRNDANHVDTDCAWDAVGNVYYIDWWFGNWRTFSPPGTNQATTVALANIQMKGGGPPPSSTLQITKITVAGGNVNIDFSASTNDSASSFTVQGSATVTGTYSPIAGAVITQLGPGLFHATFTAGPATQYFRIAGQGTTTPPTQPTFTKLSVSGANVILTFSGSSSDSASAFTILSASTLNGTYSPNASANITQISPGVFQASLPASGPTQFYRIRR